MKLYPIFVICLFFFSLDAEAAEPTLWIVQPKQAGDLSDCPRRAEDAVKAKSTEARPLATDAVIFIPDFKIPLRGKNGEDEKIGDLIDRCFALTVDGQAVISGAAIQSQSTHSLRFPVLQLLTLNQGEGLRFHLKPALPEEEAAIPFKKWWDKVEKLRGDGGSRDYKAGALARLTRYIGTYRYDEIFKDPDIIATLDGMMSAKEKAVLRENLQVAAPVAFSGTHIVLQGNKPHAGGSDYAMVAIRPVDGTVHAVVVHSGKVVHYKDKRDNETAPATILDFVMEAERIIKAWKESK